MRKPFVIFLFAFLCQCIWPQSDVTTSGGSATDTGPTSHNVEITIWDKELDLPLEGATIRDQWGGSHACDGSGKAVLGLPPGKSSVIIIEYPGYQTKRLVVEADADTIETNLVPSGVLENRELVLEGKREGKTDEALGESVAIDREEIKQTAKIGLVEDVMSSIKTLPGVGFTGGWNALPSIRGGDPNDGTACLDGFYITYPFHWGGAFSIFNPNAVESAKLSHGVFSVRHGNASSGLLEIASLDPPDDQARANLGLSTSATELELSFPLMGRGGVFLGGKVTYWDPFVESAKLLGLKEVQAIAQSPYIRDAYLKANYRFTPGLEWYLNGFFGSDGIGLKASGTSELEGETYTYETTMNYWNRLGFLSTGLNNALGERLLMKLMLGGSLGRSETRLSSGMGGSRGYSSDFIDDWDLFGDGIEDGLIMGESGYTLDDMSSTGSQVFIDDSAQGRFDVDWQATDQLSVSLGLNEYYQYALNEQVSEGWTEAFIGYDPYTDAPFAASVPLELSTSDEGSHNLNSAAYLLTDFADAKDIFSFDVGVRGDHYYFLKEGFELSTMPTINPRANVGINLAKEKGPVDLLALSLGSGLFSKLTVFRQFLDETMGLDSQDFKPDRSWNSVAGIELRFGGEYKVTLEGYYKHYYDRFYANVVNSSTSSDIVPHFDGKAEIWGIDFMIQKFSSRFVDGWITYSFCDARYRNPVLDAGSISNSGGPLSTDWYHPSFHRFHTANLVLNVRPNPVFTITTQVSLASGKLIEEEGRMASYPLVQSDGSVAERWTRQDTYSDDLRSGISIPVNFRFSWSKYAKKSKVRSEFYIGVENAFVNLYEAKGNTSYSTFTGKEQKDPTAVDFSIGIPMPSIGYTWSY